MPILNEWKSLPIHTKYGSALAWSPDGRSLASSNDADSIDLWDMVTQRLLRTLEGHSNGIDALAWSPSPTLIASASGDIGPVEIGISDPATGERLHLLTAHDDYLSDLTFSPDGHLLASSAGEVELWDALRGARLRSLDGLSSICFSPDGRTIATGARGGRAWISNRYDYGAIKIWDVGTGEERRTLLSPYTTISQLIFGSDGDTLVSYGRGDASHVSQARDDLIIVWDVNTGHANRTIHVGHDVWSISLHPKRNLLAVGGADMIRFRGDQTGGISLWDLQTGSMVETVAAHTLWTEIVAFSPTGELLVSEGHDREVKLWKVTV